jgi:hypothetical protein
MSLTGGHGKEALAAGRCYVAEGLARIVASDAHGASRPPSLGAAWAAMIDARVPPRTAWSVAREEPAQLLRGGVRARLRLAA